MTSIAILGDSLRTLCIGHHILDVAPEAEISIITDRAEIGLIGEVPGMVSSWPPGPPPLDFGDVHADAGIVFHSCSWLVAPQSYGNSTFEKRMHVPSQNESNLILV